MIYTCAGRGTCNPSCPMYGFCHCGCGGRPSISPKRLDSRPLVRGRPMTFINFHYLRGKGRPPWLTGGPKYSRNGMFTSVLRPEIDMLLRFHTQRRLAELLGVHESWVSRLRRGQYKRVRFEMAMRITELARGGGRHIADDVARKEKSRTQQAARRARQKADMPEGRTWTWKERSREGGEHVCTICDSHRATPHALYLHAMNAHGDRSQGRSAWNKAVVA